MIGVDERAVRSALNEIIDPCSAAAAAPAGLEDMGLVRSVAIHDGPAGAIVEVELSLTQPFCVMGLAFKRSAEERLMRTEGVARADVMLTSGIDWTPEKMSAGYRARLAEVRARKRAAAAA